MESESSIFLGGTVIWLTLFDQSNIFGQIHFIFYLLCKKFHVLKQQIKEENTI